EMVESIQSSDLEQVDKDYRSESISQLNNLPAGFHLYADTSNIFNTIIFVESEYIYISKRMAGEYLAQLENYLEVQWEGEMDSFEKVDSKYLHSKSKEIVKVSYQLNYEEASSYLTQYVVSTKDNSMAVLITSQDYIDLEKQIKELKVL
ncbi:MAG: hypothetical protein WBH03_05725, partial [Cyclobacteriaceae bacterium]